MVALFIGVFLLSGALTIYASSRSTIELSGQLSRINRAMRDAKCQRAPPPAWSIPT